MDADAISIEASWSKMGLLDAFEGFRIPDAQLWVKPDFGPRTRGWAEVRPALVDMVEAAHRARTDAPR